MENGGRFSDHQVDQLRRLAGWSPKSAIVHIYIRKIIEEYSDTLALITPGRHGLIAIKKGSNATFCLLQGLATRFVLNAAMENGGRFTDNQVDQLRRLEGGGGGGPPKVPSSTYTKKIIEEYSDTLALITPRRHGLISVTFNFTVICQIDNSQQSCTLLSSSNVRTFSMTLEAVTVNFSQNFPFVVGFLFNIDQLNKHKLCFLKKNGAMITDLYHACNFLALTSTVSNLYNRILIYKELPWRSIQFHDYLGLANELL